MGGLSPQRAGGISPHSPSPSPEVQGQKAVPGTRLALGQGDGAGEDGTRAHRDLQEECGQLPPACFCSLSSTCPRPDMAPPLSWVMQSAGPTGWGPRGSGDCALRVAGPYLLTGTLSGASGSGGGPWRGTEGQSPSAQLHPTRLSLRAQAALGPGRTSSGRSRAHSWASVYIEWNLRGAASRINFSLFLKIIKITIHSTRGKC